MTPEKVPICSLVKGVRGGNKKANPGRRSCSELMKPPVKEIDHQNSWFC